MKIDLSPQALRPVAISELMDDDKLGRDNGGAHMDVLDK